MAGAELYEDKTLSVIFLYLLWKQIRYIIAQFTWFRGARWYTSKYFHELFIAMLVNVMSLTNLK